MSYVILAIVLFLICQIPNTPPRRGGRRVTQRDRERVKMMQERYRNK